MFHIMMLFAPMKFVENLRYMGLGMLGIFTVTAVLMLIIIGLKKLFPSQKPDTSRQEEQ